MTPTPSHCAECGATLPADAPRGACPRCLLLRGFESIPPDVAADPRHTVHLVLPEEPDGALPFPEIGDYELLKEIGRGGMGVVYQARQRGLERLVAIKLIRAGSLARAEGIARFKLEAAATARLRHPGIVAIYEAGEHEGQHFYSMDFVPGRSLAAALRDGPFAPRRAAECVRAVAEAIHYAHEQSVVHRDLKPSNILLDAEDKPRVSDFGLVKLLQSDSELTLTGAVLGTPNYMPPEQARGRHTEVSACSDVYSLGAILYECLTGRPPFTAATALETMKLVVDQEPVAPRVLNPTLPRDLETICLKCLAKGPSGRYASAQALAAELDRFLAGEPIHARPVTAAERAWRWCRREPAWATVLAAGLVVPFAFAGLLLVMNSKVGREAHRALAQETRATNALVRAESSEQSAREHAYAADVYAAFHALEQDDFAYAFKIVEGYLTNSSNRYSNPAANSLLGFEWRLLWQRTRGEQALAVTNPLSPAICLAFSPDGRTLLAGGEDGIGQWSLPDGKWLGNFFGAPATTTAHSVPRVKSMGFIDQGRRLLVGAEDALTCWSYPQPVLQFALPEQDADLALPNDERTVAVGVWNSAAGSPADSDHPFSVTLYDLASRQVKKVLPGYGSHVAFSPDGQWILTGSRSNGVVLWHPETGRQTKIKPDHGKGGLSFSPDSQFLAFGGWQKSIHVMEVHPLRLCASFTGFELGANVLAWLPDNSGLFSVGLDQTVKFWRVPRAPPGRRPIAPPDRPNQTEHRSFFGHTSPISTLALSRDGKWMASGSLDKTILVWHLGSSMPQARSVVLPPRASNWHFDPVSGCIVTYSNASLTVWNPATAATPARVLPGTEGLIEIGSLSAGSNFVVLHPGSRDQPFRLEIRELPDGRVRSRIELPELTPSLQAAQPESAMKAAISPDGRWLAWTREQGVELYDLSARQLRPRLQELTSNGAVHKIQFSPNSQWLVVIRNSTRDSGFTVVEPASGRARASVTLAREPDSMTAANIDPSSRYLATGGDRQNSIRIWDLDSGRLLGTCNGNVSLGGMVWSPDGQTLAAVGYLGLRLWSTRFHIELANLEPRSGFIPCGFTADGRTLVSCSQSGQVRRDTAPTLEEIFKTPR